jgi:hypothetical protein
MKKGIALLTTLAALALPAAALGSNPCGTPGPVGLAPWELVAEGRQGYVYVHLKTWLINRSQSWAEHMAFTPLPVDIKLERKLPDGTAQRRWRWGILDTGQKIGPGYEINVWIGSEGEPPLEPGEYEVRAQEQILESGNEWVDPMFSLSWKIEGDMGSVLCWPELNLGWHHYVTVTGTAAPLRVSTKRSK